MAKNARTPSRTSALGLVIITAICASASDSSRLSAAPAKSFCSRSSRLRSSAADALVHGSRLLAAA